ncbi:IclR family transcriptional regulator [Mycolicibacter sp. MYC123]|uniref:IclR family transcriptional regulator n=1 Tax=[Mycobacterium] zoologicum TaxID=2872311 RepID=A0ABU5YHL4_9MYCO|nr:IclR family transcriptional regulator [Mycolicibacter sp. MYC123]MEB3048248.1 IclR family transcriptional regulator [Mycolicibacter sp. MYC123]
MSTPTATIDRVSLVLDAFDGPGHLTLTQVVRRTGLPRSSAHRMLERLVQLRFLRRRGRDFELGMRLVELGHLAVHQDRVHQAAIPFLWNLHRATGLVVHLAILDGTDVVYLDKIGGRMGAALPSRVGGRHRAHCTGVGKALLAHADVHAELDTVRARGFAVDREESVAGFGCVAAPIGAGDDTVAAVSVCGPVDRMPFEKLVAPVRMTATRIWADVDERMRARELQLA